MSALASSLFAETKHHAHLLTDSEGPYGVEVDAEVEPDMDGSEFPWPVAREKRIIVRPDRLHDNDSLPTLFQMVPHKRAGWALGSEVHLIDALHDRMLSDRGIAHLDDITCRRDAAYWRQWYGLRRSATRTINSLVLELYETIPDDLLKTVRRYPIRLRKGMYSGLCSAGPRARQLANTFPYLAAGMYMSQENERYADARKLVESGARLHEIAEAAEIPVALKRLKPGVLFRIHGEMHEFLRDNHALVSHHCPATVPKQRAWLGAIANAARDYDGDFAVWVAKHFDRLGHWREVPAIVGDLSDWVKSTAATRVLRDVSPSEVDRIRNALTATSSTALSNCVRDWWDALWREHSGRPFDRRMLPSTVLRLSGEWHEFIAKTKAADHPFPDPWYDGGTVGAFTVTPIKAADELSRYAYKLHNCATQYSENISQGSCFLYVVENSDSVPVAMAEILADDVPKLGQLKGPCNNPVDKSVRRAVRTWLKRQQQKNGKGRVPELKPAWAPCSDVPF